MSGIRKPSLEKSPAEASIRDIVEFMKNNPPKDKLTSSDIDSIIVENAKALLAYQAEISLKDTKEPYPLKYFKHRRFAT